MRRPKFHKLYFPGLISLVCLPIMCISYLLIEKSFHRYRLMDVAWITKSELNKMVKRDMPGLKFDIETFRKYEVLKITGDIKDDAIKLKRLGDFIKPFANFN